MEQERSHINVKGKTQVRETLIRSNTEVICEVGLSHSSEETSVMGAERRAKVISFGDCLTTNPIRMNKQPQTRGIPITKQMVFNAYKKVKRNRGSAGVDNESITEFDENLKGNLYLLWNRMSSGTYFPPPVKEVLIPKGDGKMRKLGIPTVRDRIAQEVIKSYIEPKLEKEFSENSYGYRPLKNTHQAVEAVRKNTRKYSWVIDLDIKGFFDNMSYEKLMKALGKHFEEKWVMMYVERWLKAPILTKDSGLIGREKGTPQGGVISPILANLFLHYAFDKWFVSNYPILSFVRYADDIIIHCNSETEAEEVFASVRERLSECELELNQEKSKIAYCKDGKRTNNYKTIKFDFLGFSFQPRTAKNKNSGNLFLGFDCAISRKSETKIAKELRDSSFHKLTKSSIYEIAKTFNPKLRGWYNYFCKFRPHKLNRIFGLFNWRLIKWAVKKFKRFNGSMRQAGNWIRRLAIAETTLFVHWQYGFGGA